MNLTSAQLEDLDAITEDSRDRETDARETSEWLCLKLEDGIVLGRRGDETVEEEEEAEEEESNNNSRHRFNTVCLYLLV